MKQQKSFSLNDLNVGQIVELRWTTSNVPYWLDGEKAEITKFDQSRIFVKPTGRNFELPITTAEINKII